MKTLLKRVAVGLLAALACALGSPVLAAPDCTTATQPNVSGTLANAQFEILQKLCANSGGSSSVASPLTYTVAAGSPITLSASWQKVATTTTATRALLISDVTGTSYDIRWTVTTAGGTVPLDTRVGQNVGFQEAFAFGVPLGDVYLKSASGAQASVYVGN